MNDIATWGSCQSARLVCHISNGYVFCLQGKWSEEETARLCELVTEVGRKWVKIGQELNRLHWDCRDHYREVSSCDPVARNAGKWTPEESYTLQQAVNDYMQAQQVPRSLEDINTVPAPVCCMA